MAKTQFQSTEDLYVTFEPFIDPTTGEYIEGGDTAGCDVTTPSGTTTLSLTRDALTKVWYGSIALASFEAGLWLFRATSDDSSSPKPQYRACWWGSGAIEQVNSVYTRLGAPAGASIAADIASAYARLGAPAGASLAADIAGLGTGLAGVDGRDLSDVYDLAKAVQRLLGNDWVLDPDNQKILVYDDAGYLAGAGVVLYAWDTFDSSGNATTARIFRRLVGSPP